MSSLKMLSNSLILFITAYSATGIQASENHDIPCEDVFLTVSSLPTRTKYGNIELNWNTKCENLPEWIGLFAVDPKLVPTTPLVKVIIDEKSPGFYRTNTSIEPFALPGGWHKKNSRTASKTESSTLSGEHCLPFWIASYKQDFLRDVNCLKIQPTWMGDNREKLERIPLAKIIIPGTHNSGSFYTEATNNVENGFHRFVMTQNHDVWAQLVMGIRYLDLRIGYYPPSNRTANASAYSEEDGGNQDISFWINHDLVKVTPLVPLLQDVKNFIKEAKDEIVIIDIHRLPIGFYLLNGDIRYDRHQLLVNLITKELGDLAVDYKHVSVAHSNLHLLDGPRLSDIWETGKRLIICYPEDSISRGSSLLWPPLKQMWGNKQTPSELKKYLRNAIFSRPLPTSNMQGNYLWALMAQLTPSTFDIIFKPDQNLKKMADSINRNLTQWVKNDWWRAVNIIATDFFMGNNLIQVAIDTISLKTTHVDSEN